MVVSPQGRNALDTFFGRGFDSRRLHHTNFGGHSHGKSYGGVTASTVI